jgi:hypothetical protein
MVLRPWPAGYLPVIINMRLEAICIISLRENALYLGFMDPAEKFPNEVSISMCSRYSISDPTALK